MIPVLAAYHERGGAVMDSRKIIGFVPTRDAKKAKTFYQGTLGLRCVSEDEFALVLDANGFMVRVTKVGDFNPQPFTILGWEVDDIGRLVSELEKKGLRLERYGMKGQDERGIWTAPGGARVAWFKDPDGNVLSLTQFPS
jgi:catechol 2,3-dioxygenase-like lactoylglutathione lyase family enzyme